MDETATRRKKIAPALYDVGWEQVPENFPHDAEGFVQWRACDAS